MNMNLSNIYSRTAIKTSRKVKRFTGADGNWKVAEKKINRHIKVFQEIEVSFGEENFLSFLTVKCQS